MASSVSHADANRIIRAQFQNLIGRPATDLEALYIQAIGWLESNYGRAKGQHAAWADQGLYNWANIEKIPNKDGSCDAGWTLGKDGPNSRCFRVFPSDDEAAKALVYNLTKRHWPVLQSIANEGTAEGVARAMTVAPAYFEASVSSYANAIRGAIKAIETQVPTPTPHVVPPSKFPTGLWWKMPAIAYGTYRLLKWVRK